MPMITLLVFYWLYGLDLASGQAQGLRLFGG